LHAPQVAELSVFVIIEPSQFLASGGIQKMNARGLPHGEEFSVG
jgi:hypothetical protein